MKNVLVCGAGGFIGRHLTKKLRAEDNYVVGADLKWPEFNEISAICSANCSTYIDLRDSNSFAYLWENFGPFNEIYQLAADMGGAGYIFTGEHDSQVMINSCLININLCKFFQEYPGFIWRSPGRLKIFFSSSACVYPAENQITTDRPVTSEHTAYPANPDSEYGWEKLFSERLYFSMVRNYGLNMRVARFHNVFGPYGSYNNGKEKAPAAICRKIAELPPEGGTIEIWGDGCQTRSFLYIDEALEGVARFMNSPYKGPLNIGSEEIVSINDLVCMVAMIAGKDVAIKHIDGPLGVRGRSSDNRLIREKLNWEPTRPLLSGLQETYKWIEEKVNGTETKKNRTGS